jgi:hypothetical protein
MTGKVCVPKEYWNEPYGDVLRIEKEHTYVPVSEWDHDLKMWVVTHEMENPDEIVADDLKRIAEGNCRKCHQVIKPYLKKYFERHQENGYSYCFEFSQELGYCEECAKEKAAVGYINNCVPDLVETKRIYKDRQMIEVKVYADGSTIEEMTFREIRALKK